MKTHHNNSERALTLIEVLVILAVIVIVAALFLPGVTDRPNPRTRARHACVMNLKQVGQAFHEWTRDHNGRFPMELSMGNGGTAEFVTKGGVRPHFLIISNYMETPKIIHCPSDKTRKSHASFTAGFTESNISYFIGVDAQLVFPSMFLTGDRNVTNDMPLLANRIMELTSNSIVGWTEEIHQLQGNVGLSDGSVQRFSTSKLRENVAYTGITTNRLAMPWY